VALARIASSTSELQAAIGDAEYAIFRDQIDTREVTSPIFLPGLARSGSTILLTELDKAHGIDLKPEFNEFFTQHLRKIQFLLDCNQFLSEGNNNFLRIPYLMELFRDARFLIPVRQPMAHIMSLARQHLLFTESPRGGLTRCEIHGHKRPLRVWPAAVRFRESNPIMSQWCRRSGPKKCEQCAKLEFAFRPVVTTRLLLKRPENLSAHHAFEDRADEENGARTAGLSPAAAQLVPGEGRGFRGQHRRIQQQGETDPEKILRIQDLQSHGNGLGSCTWRST